MSETSETRIKKTGVKEGNPLISPIYKRFFQFRGATFEDSPSRTYLTRRRYGKLRNTMYNRALVASRNCKLQSLPLPRAARIMEMHHSLRITLIIRAAVLARTVARNCSVPLTKAIHTLKLSAINIYQLVIAIARCVVS